MATKPIENDNGVQDGDRFRLKRRFYTDGKEVWSNPRHGVAQLIGSVGSHITMKEAREYKLVAPAKKKASTSKAKKAQSNKSK